jgi:hypothetical protein
MQRTSATTYTFDAPAWSQRESDAMHDRCGKPTMSGRTLTNAIVLSLAFYAVTGGLAWLAFHS